MEPPCYIHYGKTTFDTGLKLELLQEYCLIALDEFRKYPYPKDRSEQTAWLSLLATEDINREAAALRRDPEEVLDMYSEALRILDRNTVRYMIEEQKKEIDEKKKEIEEKEKVIEESKKELE